MTMIVIDGLNDNVQKSDAIVILGNKVETNGIPSPTLASRLEKGLELYKQGTSNLIIVSGGLGVEGFKEGDVMRDYLVARGVPVNSIITDNRGSDTYMTAQNTKKIFDERGLDSALIVSNYFHISRVRLAFKRVGIDPVYSAHGHYFWIGDLRSVPREVLGYVYYFFRKY
jgi:uncharacterized SAM-binding protein YcdF (DUF218 family)